MTQTDFNSRQKTSHLHRSPFYLLNASTRDNAKTIIRLAEEKSLDLDQQLCQKSRADITNPRSRLGIELGWLSGVAPRRASELIQKLNDDPLSIWNESGLPNLAHLNLMSASLELKGLGDDASEFVKFIDRFSGIAEELNPNDILRDINEDRIVSGFPEIQSTSQIEIELENRRRYYISCIIGVLNNQSTNYLIETMTKIVDASTSGGTVHSPRLIDELVERYEIETQEFLTQEGDNIRKIIEAIRTVAPNNNISSVNLLIDKLDTAARNWDRVAQPIQLNAKAKGINHEHSRELAYDMRSLSIDLFNNYNLIDQSSRITALLKDIFNELSDVSDKLEQDTEALANIFEERKNALTSQAEWDDSITYSAEVGMIFKNELSISPKGVSWKNRLYKLDDVTRVRWGGLKKSVNGIPTGTSYTIAFGDERSEAVVELSSKQVFSNFTDRLWRAVGVRLTFDMLNALKAGVEFKFGEGGALRDDGVTLIRHKFLSKSEVKYSWDQVQVWTQAGNFYIGSTQDKNTYITLSYIESANAHVIEQGIRMFFRSGKIHRMSDLLN